jgi:hypothetical protein
VRVGYADPPYPGQAHLYKSHPDYDGEVDHAALVHKLEHEYDGFVLHTNSTTLFVVLPLFEQPADVRVMASVKPFAAFKPTVPVAYAWEPVLVKPCRKATVSSRITPLRDWIAENTMLVPGFTGAKPLNVCRWLFEVLGMKYDDELVDLFPGTGAVSEAWEQWRRQPALWEAS